MNTDSKIDINDDDAGIEALLREVGHRDEPSAEVQAEVRQAVHAEWRTIVAQRTRHKHVVAYSMAAGLAAAVVGATLVFQQVSEPAQQSIAVASIARVVGESPTSVVQVSTDGSLWRDVRAGETLMSGAQLRTDASTRVALSVNGGLSLRLDGGSLLHLQSPDRAVLEHGRIYVDAPIGEHVPLNVQTRFGAIEHLGTQYQAQLLSNSLLVSVREGLVSIAAKHDTLQVAANESLALSERGAVMRQAVTSHDAAWQWAVQLAPAYDIENRSLASMLEWVARETGRTVRYASPDVRARAERLILRGSVSGLSPEQALDAVIATTNLTAHTNAQTIEIRIR